MSEEKIIIKQSTPVYGTLGIIFGFIGIFIYHHFLAPSVDTGSWHVFKEYTAGILSIVFAILDHHLDSDGILNMPNIIIYQNQGVFYDLHKFDHTFCNR